MENSLEILGYHEFQAVIAGESKTFRIYPHQLEDFRSWDANTIWGKFPHHIHVLTIHGIKDGQVPV